MFLENALIIGSNFIPLFGVLFWDWTIESILFIYWWETLIIGLFAILKIFFARFHNEGKPNWIVTKMGICAPKADELSPENVHKYSK
jgi:hypothetical protein